MATNETTSPPAGRPVERPRPPSAFGSVLRALGEDRCVILDGGLATELGPRGTSPRDERLWGTEALLQSPGAVLDVHRRYVDLGCDVITTDTWGLPGLLTNDPEQLASLPVTADWRDVARQGVRAARQAVRDGGRERECAVAFSLNGEIDSPTGRDTVPLLARVFEGDAPDLVLLETLSVVRESLFETVEGLLSIGLPLWLSFRRCCHGLCGVFGQHWGGPEGDTFGRAVRRLEELGVGALLVNCVPPDHVDGMMSYLRDFTDMPLGAYPNLGYYTNQGWQFASGVGGNEYAEMAGLWRAEGAHIVGGCCGVGPEHIAAAVEALSGTPRGQEVHPPLRLEAGSQPAPATATPWTDRHQRGIFPLPVPALKIDSRVFGPTQGSFLVWRYLFDERIGEGERCLDVGCGAGLQTVQLALNGAEHVHGIDLEPAAIDSTLMNAFRNGVAERVSAATEDLYSWVPEERYDVIVASLYQTPVDPFPEVAGHRPLDFWGRNLVDHLIGKLRQALAPDGEAYIMQLSILSQQRTSQLIAANGFTEDVVGYGFFPFTEHFAEARPQIKRVEALSDAYHLDVGEAEWMVAYLLRVRWA